MSMLLPALCIFETVTSSTPILTVEVCAVHVEAPSLCMKANLRLSINRKQDLMADVTILP